VTVTILVVIYVYMITVRQMNMLATCTCCAMLLMLTHHKFTTHHRLPGRGWLFRVGLSNVVWHYCFHHYCFHTKITYESWLVSWPAPLPLQYQKWHVIGSVVGILSQKLLKIMHIIFANSAHFCKPIFPL